MRDRGPDGRDGLKVACWGLSVQGSVWSVAVVEVSEGVDEVVEFGELVRQVVAGVELVSPRSVGAFDATVHFRGFWREDVEGNFFGLAGLFELGHELGAAIDLDASDWEGQLSGEFVEEFGGGMGGGARECVGLGEAGDWIVGGELLDGPLAGWPDGEGVDLDETSGCGGFHPLGQPERVAALYPAAAFLDVAAQDGDRLNSAARDQLLQDAADSGIGDLEALGA